MQGKIRAGQSAWTASASPGVTNLNAGLSHRTETTAISRVCLKTDPADRCRVYFFLFLARDLPSDWPFLKLACIF